PLSTETGSKNVYQAAEMAEESLMFYIKVADLLVEIDNQYDVIEKKCRDYIVEPEREPDIRVRSTDEFLEASLQTYHEDERELYSMGEIESFCLHERIYPQLPPFDAAWMHACVVAVDDAAYAFTAPSGYGKTTQGLLWLDYFGSRARIINGDNPIIRFTDGGCYVYGTPFGGSEGYQCNTRVPLKGICFLNRSNENSVTRMDSGMAFAQMMRTNEKFEFLFADNLEAMMTIWERIVEQIPFWQIYCNQSKEAVETAYRGMHARTAGRDSRK
ncbi:MAG: hypothetical protein LUC83_04365, partial [Clostridiales bacterium]|nr:hypothetical protein [Clostridiales bacterium]